jgi:purine-binding chemotaxis protein CheW
MRSRRHPVRKKTELSSADASMGTAQEGVESEKFLIFWIASERCAVRLATAAEITRVPHLTHMPLVPPSLIGLANLRGIVMPVVSLRALLNFPDVESSEQARVIVTRGDAPIGFVVDGIDGLLTVAGDQVERDEGGAGTIDPTLVDGSIKGEEGESTITLLNLSRLLSGQFLQLGVVGTPATHSVATNSPSPSPVRTLVSLLSFYLGRQEYALPLDRVREIVRLPDHISELPRPETAVLGVITLRDRLLPLVSLRALLGLAVEGRRERRDKIVVVSLGDGAIGVVADATREILHVDPSIVDPAPALLTRGEGDAEISSICRLDGGRRLVALLAPDRLFRLDVVRRILAEQSSAIESQSQPEANAMADEQFIIFRLGNQDYGIPIAAVTEIARPSAQIARLPKAPAFIDGVMNLRGSVIPIIDLRRRFDLSPVEHAGSRRILMLAIGGITAGFLVDSVSEVMKVQTGAICPAPKLSSDQVRLISRVINLEEKGRMVLLIEPAQLLDQVEADVLTKFKRAKLDASATVP